MTGSGCLLPRKIFVDAHGCAFAVADTVDNQARSEHAIATGENSRSRRHQGLRIHRDQAARRDFNLVFWSEEVETRRLSDRHDDRVALDLGLTVLVESGIEALVLIEYPLCRQDLESSNLAVLADDALRARIRDE